MSARRTAKSGAARGDGALDRNIGGGFFGIVHHMDPTSSQQLGQVVGGRFELVRHIGEGATSDVFEARDHGQQGLAVALKIMNHSRLRDPEAQNRFHREVQVQQMIQHDNVSRLYGDGVTDSGAPYIALELFRSGRSLRTVLNQEGRIDLARACDFACQALAGLSACHSVGVCHRDLKPDNMMLRGRVGGVEQVALIDFGFASLRGSERLTAHGFVVGSMSYIAPERLLGDVGDPRADIYSMGVLLYEMVTGELPFMGEDELDLAKKHLGEELPSVRAKAPDVDLPADELDAIIARAMAKEPKDRFETAAEMSYLLSQIGGAVRAATGPQRVVRAPSVGVAVYYCDTDGVEKNVLLPQGALLIGRAPECGIRSDDPLLSRQHARLYRGEDGQVWIEDLDSANGVWVGVERISRAVVPPDELVLVGSVVLQIAYGETPPVELRPGIHTRMWSWLKAERKARAATQEERNALGHRVGELHQIVEQLSQQNEAGNQEAAQRLAGELKAVREQVRDLTKMMAEVEAEKGTLAAELGQARSSWTRTNQKQMAELIALQSEKEKLTEEMERQGIEVEDLRAALRTRSEEIKGLQADLQQMAQVATAGAQDDTLALVAAQGKAAKATSRVAELEDQLEEVRGTVKELELECRDLREARDARAADEVDSRALRRQVAQLTQELESIQWREHQMHGESARIKVQLDSALAEIGELRARGSAPGQETERGRFETERARLEDRIAELEREVSHLRSGRVDDEEVARLREELVGARAESEIAWSEVEHLREKLGGNE